MTTNDRDLIHRPPAADEAHPPLRGARSGDVHQGQGGQSGFLHLYVGEEAVAVGVMQALTPADNVLSTYREHGHALARGVDAGAIMAEMYGKQEGCSGGRGGSMHLDKRTRFFGGNAIVGGHLPMAVGLALADKKQKREAITVCFFGEGAAAEGVFHEKHEPGRAVEGTRALRL